MCSAVLIYYLNHLAGDHGLVLTLAMRLKDPEIQNFTFERRRRIRPNLTFNSDPLSRMRDKSPKLEQIYAILENVFERSFKCNKNNEVESDFSAQ